MDISAISVDLSNDYGRLTNSPSCLALALSGALFHKEFALALLIYWLRNLIAGA
jgi:hypothetical protein